ncbi:hypothetical protein ASPCAL12370 [Aspergillus calidoustus]|uniref:G domain-containing protein n=1 Tax=Aspergillus calidoustus TaxID=454130 RepID=A0A0U5GH26_ASPCI|nr:hypothetical protein ASPCAL12370 [Aspergillus calidoustus]
MPIIDLNNGWKAFSEAVSSTMENGIDDFLKNNINADLFIVTGEAGVGKSSFVKSITLEDVYIGSTLESGTTTTSLVPAIIGDKRCLFLDMPGFNTRDFDDWDIFVRLMTGLSVVRQYVQFRGVFYVDAMLDNRVSDSATKVLNWLANFCGESYMPNVTIVTTHWSGLDPDGVQEKLALVDRWTESDLFRPFLSNGAQIYHHGLDMRHGKYTALHKDNSAVRRGMLAAEMIAARYHDPTTLQLKIYTEIANGASLDTTSAGRWLRHGTASGTAQGFPETRSAPSSNGSLARSNQQGRREERAQASESWGSQVASVLREAKPWIQLLSTAASFYMSPSPVSVLRLLGQGLPGVVEVEFCDDPPNWFESVDAHGVDFDFDGLDLNDVVFD